jgi:hypothetical protein
MPDGHIYFHSPCFDGIASAVLAWDFLDARRGWTTPSLQAVDYDRRGRWLRESLDEPAAVVDFLYHPDVRFWADHHQTAFLTDEARRRFDESCGADLVYDPRAGSCAMLLWEQLSAAFDHRTSTYQALVEWADKIDAARYASVQEAIESTAPALSINRSLVAEEDDGYPERLVRALRRQPVDEVAELAEVRERVARARALSRAGLDRFSKAAHLEADGIVVFDVDAGDALVNRYAPYYFYPDARYSAGIVRSKDGVKVTAMRNPWREFRSVPLGRIAETLGGGGHQRIGSIALDGERASEATVVRDRLVREIRSQEAWRPRDPSA